MILTDAKYLQRKILEWGGNVYAPKHAIRLAGLHSTQITHNNTHTVHRKGGGVLSSGEAGRKIRIENTRESLCYFVQWARTSIEKERLERTRNTTHSFNFLHNTQAFFSTFLHERKHERDREVARKTRTHRNETNQKV